MNDGHVLVTRMENDDERGMTDHDRERLTWMFALQRVVMLPIFEPVTPGAFRSSIDCKIPSRSATHEDMMDAPVQVRAYFRWSQPRRYYAPRHDERRVGLS